MEIIGKVNHKRDQIEQRFKEGFRKFELYSKEELFNQREIGKLVSIKESLGIEFISVHTPHIKLERLKELNEMIEQVTNKLDAKYIVMHTSFVRNYSSDFLEMVRGKKILENTKETSPQKVLELIGNGFSFCLDVAHLFRNSYVEKYDYIAALEKILEKGSKSVKLVHFCDSTPECDNVSFGKGIMDIERSFDILRKYYDGYVVVEVPRDTMKKDWDYLEKLMSRSIQQPKQ